MSVLKVYISLLLLAIATSGFAQIPYYKKARQLTKNDSTDAQKVATISDWITTHIRYDAKAYQRLKFKEYSPQQIKRRKKGLCEDYAKLYTAMLQIPVQIDHQRRFKLTTCSG